MQSDLDSTYSRLFLDKNEHCHISVLLAGTEHVGTSWSALTLAYALNLLKQRILLIDGNGNFSNISTYIPIQNPLYLDNYFLGKNTLNQLITAYKNKDFNILTAFPGNNYIEKLPLGRIHVFMNDFRTLIQNYDQALIDIGSEINDNNFALCQMADNLVFVLSERNSDLAETLEIIKFMQHKGIKAEYKIIINKVNSSEDGYKIFKELYKAIERNNLSIPNLLGIIRADTRVRDTIRNKELLLSRYPTSEAAIDIKSIAQKFITEQNNG